MSLMLFLFYNVIYCTLKAFTKNRLKSGIYVTKINAIINIPINGKTDLYICIMGFSNLKLEINKFIPTGGVK